MITENLDASLTFLCFAIGFVVLLSFLFYWCNKIATYEENKELKRLRAENKELKRLRDNNEELKRLREENSHLTYLLLSIINQKGENKKNEV